VTAKVVTSDKTTVTVKTDDSGETLKVPGDVSNYDVVVAESIEVISDNLAEMEVFNEGVILHQIKQRYESDHIYTFVGNILIALNPYQRMDIYGDEVMSTVSIDVKANRACKPHVFSIGAMALHAMMQDDLDQSVLISGESGAGKTETTKKVLTYFSAMAGSTASRAGVSVESQILDSNPLLESFGNAKTVRNNNSSRFGKYMEVNFTNKFAIKGCNIISYLLEKTRVVTQMPSERNYHSFYMLLAGASAEMKEDLFLKPADEFNYLNQSGCCEIAGRSELEEYNILNESMAHLNLEQEVQYQIFQTLAGILQLGNVKFMPSRDVEGGSEVADEQCMQMAASLLGCDAEALSQSLCFKDSTFGIGDTITIPLDPVKARDQCDAFAKFIYGALFDHIVFLVNNILFRGRVARNIGVLDIFGFEVFKFNSFEQLCINYCNERLQTFFNEVIFENEKKVYEVEDIDTSNITFQDNVGCLHLIDKKVTGIFSILDEEGVVPRGSDQKFIARLHSQFDESDKTKNPYYVRNRRKPNDFGVKHFAGDVHYTVDGFLEKNKDMLSPVLIKLMEDSSVRTISTMVTNQKDVEKEEAVPSTGRKSAKTKDKMTLACKFKLDLDSLMTSLQSTQPHFIRCVKPNDQQKPNLFTPPLALRQLKYAGLFEAIHIRKAGFAIRMPHETFVMRYKHCCKCSMGYKRKEGDDLKALAQQMMDEVAADIGLQNPPAGEGDLVWVNGKTKLFFKTLKAKFALEELRNSSVDFVAVIIQRMLRGCMVRLRMYEVRMKANESLELERRALKENNSLMAAEDEASRLIEEDYRLNSGLRKKMEEEKREKLRKEFERVKQLRLSSATCIQRHVRGSQGRSKARTAKVHISLERAINGTSEIDIQKAILLVDELGVKTKQARTLRQNAKDLLLEVQGESYIKVQLEEAIVTASDELLANALELAEHAGMVYLEVYKRAKLTFANVLQKRSVLGKLQALLDKCNSVPKLLAHQEKLNEYVAHCTEIGLGGEYLVQDTLLRVKRLGSLMVLRDEIRYAVEVCSPARIEVAMAKRNKLVHIFGEELCAEEVAAVLNMRRMFALLGDDDKDEERRAQSTDDEEEEDGDDDAKLPPFVRSTLDLLRSAKAQGEEEVQRAESELQLLVPDKALRTRYGRMFKWVVSFATWHYSKEAANVQIVEHPEDDEDEITCAGGMHSGRGYIAAPARSAQEKKTMSTVRQFKSSPGKSKNGQHDSKGLSIARQMYQKRLHANVRHDGNVDDTISAITSPTHMLSLQSSGGSPLKQSTYIPFSERQSKSAVAAHEALRKKKLKEKKNAPTTKADKMIQDVINENHRFYQRNKGFTTFSA